MRKIELDPESVRAARREAGFTLDDVAKATDIPKSTLGAIENRPRLAEDRARRLARALRCKVEELERKQ